MLFTFVAQGAAAASQECTVFLVPPKDTRELARQQRR